MTSTTSTSRPVRATPTTAPDVAREWGVDLARGVAIISMFVAHTAPTAGPGGVLMLSEYLTFPLFALLVGAGVELGARRTRVWEHGAASLVRAAALLLAGWLLAKAGAWIVIVLAPLGLLTLLCWAVSRLPSWGVALVGLGAGLVAPWSIEASRSTVSELALAQETGRLWWFELLVSAYYPQAVLLLVGCAGILVTRLLVPRDGRPASWPTTGVVIGASGAVFLALAALHLTGRTEIVAYRTTWPEELFVTAFAVGVFAVCLVVARARLVRQVLAPLAWVGAMTLTVYVLHVGWLAWWVRGLHPGVSDDAWSNVIGMSVAALLLATLWRLLRAPRPWSRGPLEGVVGLAVQLATAGVRDRRAAPEPE
ncbi:heparan-alpha-glucosaminide N-acetyltransferase domain-containing protein [Nocardioides jishulii]|uniref:Heparan-alpha-glucosaminide N-acetyltransferase catalytic domain-containing protein n=1 Tax=Nocardioides jishulii TaxID=2575440 RepID=A0A4U2YL26_9ACTN|nr:heparan-alpha-glucosaminide N-acetyltransferase domain-containing protein [Nocardioides jishulii]QCX27002.1 hypothetical protein FCL41_05250 [Nocardioides jishulii]TKI61484.1 hypothetical protein FC770_11885 [Nocardioides jishulii]